MKNKKAPASGKYDKNMLDKIMKETANKKEKMMCGGIIKSKTK
jgi:hypothetical protein